MLAIVCGVTACSRITGPLPPNAEQFTAPAVYARWWAMTEACSGRSGDLAAVQWFHTPGFTLSDNGQDVVGYWNSGSNRIVLAKDYTDDGAAVRHEMLHALLRVPGHPRAQFLGVCTSLVGCTGICVTDAGPWHAPSDHAVVPPDSLELGAHATLLPSELDGQRWLALSITARNPRGRAVTVAVPGEPGTAPVNPVTPPTFAYDLRGPEGGIGGNLSEADSSTLFFQPFETKQWLFEFRVASDLTEFHIPPGTYLVRGGYARRWSAYDTVAVGP